MCILRQLDKQEMHFKTLEKSKICILGHLDKREMYFKKLDKLEKHFKTLG